ncbi:MAG: zinc-binding dehydrogenase [Phycisphaerales bacterium]
MRAVVIEKQGAPVAPNIRCYQDFNDPPEGADPPPAHALLRTEASALNRMDLWVGMGLPGVDRPFPRVTGCDVCAIVEKVAHGSDPAWVGKRVIMNAKYEKPRPDSPDDPPTSTYIPDYELIGEHIHGAHRERFIAPISNLAHVGDADPVEAAAFGLVTLTAYSMVVTKGQLRPGQSVLITGIGGGVSTSALAIAKWLACPVCVTSRHQWKLDRAKQLGADWTILDQGQDWSKEARNLTGKRGFDMAIDSVGKATHLTCIKSLTRGGAYVSCGSTTGPDATTDLARLFWNQLRILGSTMGSNAEFREIAALFRAGRLKPVIDKVFPWSEAPAAWERLEKGEQFGKIVLKW